MRDKRYAIGDTRWTVWLLLLAFLALAVTYSVVTPIFEASDELWHYPVVQYIAAGHGLPVQTPPDRPGLWKQQASQPPLYYALAALLTLWTDTSDLTTTLRPNPHGAVGVVTPDGNINMVAHDPARESWPWRGTALAVHVARLLSVALSTVTVYLTYHLGREAFPDRLDIALAAAAFTAFTPMFTFISGSVNNDNLVIPLCALALLIMIRQARDAQTLSEKLIRSNGFSRSLAAKVATTSNSQTRRLMLRWVALGVVIGLAALTKLSGMLLLLPAALTGVYVAWQCGPMLKHRAESGSQLKLAQAASDGPNQGALAPFTLLARRFTSGLGWRHLFAAGLAIGVPVLTLTGWWLWRNWQLYGDPTGLKMFNPYFTRPIPADLAQIWSERTSFLYGYWGNFGGLNLPIPAWAYLLLNGLSLLAGIGLVVAFIRWIAANSQSVLAAIHNPESTISNRQLPLLLVILWGAIVLVGWLIWTRTTWSSQGRLVFYALPAYSIIMAAGLGAWLPRRVAPYAFGVVCIGMAILSAAMPFTVIAPAYARPPQLTSTQIANIPHRAEVTFGDALVLLGYDAPAVSARPGDSARITLYWQALKPTDRDYSVFVHLLDEDEIEKQDKGPAYPGRGNLPTTTLAPGQTWAETWVMPVDATSYAPARMTWEVGLYDASTGQRLPAVDKTGHTLGDNLRFGQIELARLPGSLYNPLSFNFGDQIELIGYDLDRRAARPGETAQLTLFWRALQAPTRDYTIFAHVLGPQQTKAAAVDMQPTPSTSSWKQGQVVSSTYPLEIKAVLPDVYDIMLGVYYFTGASSFERLKILTRDGRQQQDTVLLGKLRVTR
jgi:hypothetical protein